jgi:hypothetical protein
MFRIVWMHGLGTPGGEITFTARLKLTPTPKIFRYGQSIFILPHQPKFSDFFEIHGVSGVRVRMKVHFKGTILNI